MPLFRVDVDVTYRGVIQVEASSVREARIMAERGPSAWLGPLEAADHAYTEVADVTREGGDDGEDEMQLWRDREDNNVTRD